MRVIYFILLLFCFQTVDADISLSSVRTDLSVASEAESVAEFVGHDAVVCLFDDANLRRALYPSKFSRNYFLN